MDTWPCIHVRTASHVGSGTDLKSQFHRPAEESQVVGQGRALFQVPEALPIETHLPEVRRLVVAQLVDSWVAEQHHERLSDSSLESSSAPVAVPDTAASFDRDEPAEQFRDYWTQRSTVARTPVKCWAPQVAVESAEDSAASRQVAAVLARPPAERQLFVGSSGSTPLPTSTIPSESSDAPFLHRQH